MCAREGAGLGAYLHSVEDAVFEDVFEDVFEGGGCPPMHPGWTGACGVKLEKIGRWGGFYVSPQVSGKCVSTRMGWKGERDAQRIERESARVRETGIGVWDQMLREFRGGGHVVEDAVGEEIGKGESQRVNEQERLYTKLKYKSNSAEKRERGGIDHDPLSLSVPPPLLEVKEDAERDEGVGGGGSDCPVLAGGLR